MNWSSRFFVSLVLFSLSVSAIVVLLLLLAPAIFLPRRRRRRRSSCGGDSVVSGGVDSAPTLNVGMAVVASSSLVLFGLIKGIIGYSSSSVLVSSSSSSSSLLMLAQWLAPLRIGSVVDFSVSDTGEARYSSFQPMGELTMKGRPIRLLRRMMGVVTSGSVALDVMDWSSSCM